MINLGDYDKITIIFSQFFFVCMIIFISLQLKIIEKEMKNNNVNIILLENYMGGGK